LLVRSAAEDKKFRVYFGGFSEFMKIILH